MPYAGSYIWKLRQKVGNMHVILPCVDTICLNEKHEVLMVYNLDFDGWTFPGGSVELGTSWEQSAAQEALEEAAIRIAPDDLTPFAIMSGGGYTHTYKDGSVQFFGIAFVATEFAPSDTPLDATEISHTKWYSLEEAATLKKTPSATHFLPALEQYLKTGKFQQIVIDEPVS